jgi:hypothetical protein
MPTASPRQVLHDLPSVELRLGPAGPLLPVQVHRLSTAQGFLITGYLPI